MGYVWSQIVFVNSTEGDCLLVDFCLQNINLEATKTGHVWRLLFVLVGCWCSKQRHLATALRDLL